ncbi:MAG: 7-carboxy-7-deazaguanine synthase QueE [Planctomycetes bacterium]|nr:7-carboxy-7-deazaguanine synthase QueE [Planctomycetota bacterium]
MVAPVGHLQELFVSFQGEGSTVGTKTLFVRMAGCSLRCRFCDTPKALVRTEWAEFQGLLAADGSPRRQKNPLTVEDVVAAVDELDPSRRCWISFTGGEPLEQVEFLVALAPRLAPRPRHLETAGVHAAAMERLRPHLEWVAFDLKLDSVAHEGDRTEEHRAFLRASRGVGRCAKAIIGPTTDVAELGRLAALVAEEDRTIPFILQPETPRHGGAPELLFALLNACHDAVASHLADVRVIPQTHKFLRLP